jgi:hypothetical protein
VHAVGEPQERDEELALETIGAASMTLAPS